MPCPACIQIDQVVAAVVHPPDDGYETGDSNESLAMEAAIDELTVTFTNFLHIANRHQCRHNQGAGWVSETGVQAMNIVHDLQFK